MYKDVLTHANMVNWAVMGLVVFFAVFVLTTLWAMTRPKRQIEEWSAIPLAVGSDDAMNPERSKGEGASHA